jgi:hypothetical protein
MARAMRFQVCLLFDAAAKDFATGPEASFAK